jgi:hypothetical protein
MRLFDFLQKKNPFRKNAGSLKKYSGFKDILAPEQMIPARQADGSVALNVRETDNGIARISKP